jgi:hypothetical protein
MKSILKNNYNQKNNRQKSVLEYSGDVFFKNLKLFYLNYIF